MVGLGYPTMADVTPASVAQLVAHSTLKSTPQLWVLRWNILVSRFPGLRGVISLVGRTFVACVVVLCAARAGATFGASDDDEFYLSKFVFGNLSKRLRWRRADVSLEVYTGATSLVIPFLLLPVYTALKNYFNKLRVIAHTRRTPRWDAEFVFLSDRRTENAKQKIRATDSMSNSLPWMFRLINPTASQRELGKSPDDVEDALQMLARCTKQSGGEDVSEWLRKIIVEDQKNEKNTTAIVFVRDRNVSAETSGSGKRNSKSRNTPASVHVDDVDDRWSISPAVTSEDPDGDNASQQFDDSDDSESSSETSSSEGYSSRDGEFIDSEFGGLVVVLVVHVTENVSSESLGPEVSARGVNGWCGDASRFFRTVPKFVSVANVEVPCRFGVPGLFVSDFLGNGLSSVDTAEAIKSVAPVLAHRFGVDAVVFPSTEDAPTPMLHQSLASLGAHAVLRRPVNDPGFVLRLDKRSEMDDGVAFESNPSRLSAWDGASCGAHRRARRDYRQAARRFAKAGGTVVVCSGSAESTRDENDAWTRELRWCATSGLARFVTSGGGRVTSAVGGVMSAAGAVTTETIGSTSAIGATSAIDDVSSKVSSAMDLDLIRNDTQVARSLESAARCGTSNAPGGWRVLEVRGGEGEHLGALVLETRPGSGDKDADATTSERTGDGNMDRRIRTRRRRATGLAGEQELFAVQNKRIWVRACWLLDSSNGFSTSIKNSKTSDIKKGDVYAALLRGAIEFAVHRGCTWLDLGPGGAKEKTRLGALQHRATSFVLFRDWTLSAPANADAKALSKDLLLWASNGANGGRRRADGEDVGDEGGGGRGRTQEMGRLEESPSQASTPLSSFPSKIKQGKRALRRAARNEKRLKLKLAKLASRAFRLEVAASLDKRKSSDTKQAEEEEWVQFVEREEEDTDSEDDVLFVDAETA